MDDTIYGNTPCFLNGVHLLDQPEKMKDVDVIVYGVPWEGAVTWGDYTGCEMGPKVMRLCSARYSGYLPELDHLDVFEHLKIGDLGDVDVIPANVTETMNRIKRFAGKVWDTGKFSVALGGDHGIAYPIISALGERTKGKVGVIHLDAHYDNKNDHNGDEYARCSPFKRLYEDDGVRTESMVHMGIHGPRNTAESGRMAEAAGATTITLNEVRDTGLKASVDRAYRIASQGTEKVYLTICSDVLDYAYNPGGPPDANGLTSHELLTLVYETAKRGIAGVEFVEVYPRQDGNDFSSHFASTLVLYALAGHIRSMQSE
ncbi:MAG TPA: agmatinase family protein [Bacillales bacterium]|nr:agmatinase family protein [Bacillales bacterium]